ncbi:hypothetical protein FGIG_11989 [Fasciola gigantica]|uniref:Uncharacterized protein n=1 Tax=Fasciola gigantica TaxID=46835 RepID=A0A504YS58_FASGI|nr:hypothetical protein FGIG_11989 [Fasciola gigantica]
MFTGMPEVPASLIERLISSNKKNAKCLHSPGPCTRACSSPMHFSTPLWSRFPSRGQMDSLCPQDTLRLSPEHHPGMKTVRNSGVSVRSLF